MKPLRSILALTVALTLTPFAARAADLPASYTLEEKPFKAAIAGTSLTFALFSDAACTTQVYTTAVLVENVALITKLKQFTPKNDTKLPNTLLLQHTLAGVTAHGNLYLKVTGTGVTPVAGACQAQAATVPVPTCNDGIQNQNESDVDCGGGNCVLCQVGDSCVVNGDCNSMVCTGNVCQPPPPSCADGILNNLETDIDCGGPNCGPTCNPGQTCTYNGDCGSGICILGPFQCM